MSIPLNEFKENVYAQSTLSEHRQLEDILGSEAYRYLHKEAMRKRLIDSLVLINVFEESADLKNKIYDWHCILFPTCLALEGTLFKIAKELNMPIESGQTIGQVYEKKKIDLWLNTIDDPKIRNIIGEEIAYMSGFIQTYRNKPLHPSDNLGVENFVQAKGRHQAILARLRDLINNLLNKGLIKQTPRPSVGVRKWDEGYQPPTIKSGGSTIFGDIMDIKF